MYTNVKRLMQTAERTNCVRLTSLALRPLHFRPVVRALQFQASLKELELPGNAVFIHALTCETVLPYILAYKPTPISAAENVAKISDLRISR